MSTAAAQNETEAKTGMKFSMPGWNRRRWAAVVLLFCATVLGLGYWTHHAKAGNEAEKRRETVQQHQSVTVPSALASVSEAASAAVGSRDERVEQSHGLEESDFPVGSARYYVDPNPEGFTSSLRIQVKGKEGEAALVKVLSKESGKPIALLYASSTEPMATALPPGVYLVHYAVGKSWFGEEGLFGAKTQVYALKKPIDLVSAREGETPEGTVAIGDGTERAGDRTEIAREAF